MAFFLSGDISVLSLVNASLFHEMFTHSTLLWTRLHHRYLWATLIESNSYTSEYTKMFNKWPPTMVKGMLFTRLGSLRILYYFHVRAISKHDFIYKQVFLLSTIAPCRSIWTILNHLKFFRSLQPGISIMFRSLLWFK